jgi:hypothetical protein
MGGPPPTNHSAWEVLVWWVDGASSTGNGGSGWVLPRGCRGEVYIGAELDVWHKYYSSDPISKSFHVSMIPFGFHEGDQFNS